MSSTSSVASHTGMHHSNGPPGSALQLGHIPSGMMIPMPMTHLGMPQHMPIGVAPVGLMRPPQMTMGGKLPHTLLIIPNT